jgi:lipopolysaccharide transport system ATP-binding protein
MSDIAIRADGIGKLYKLNRGGPAYRTLREAIVSRARRPAGIEGTGSARFPSPDLIWALDDVSFSVDAGSVLGVIGRNGAGKSTLLKILSRITPPTNGRAELRGRVSSLLEVGTGFHPELSGRDNVFLSGAILGMDRRYIRRTFDEIVAFAEVEQFIDTPVKHYSSGMHLRLGFAVAAHLTADILLVDEILAVGDAAFQRKCLGKMEDVAHAGRTVVFVSHHMPSVTRMCGSVIWLDAGRVVGEGPAESVAAEYLAASAGSGGETHWHDEPSAPGTAKARLLSVRVTDPGGSPRGVFDARQPVRVEIQYRVLESLNHARIGFLLRSPNGVVVLSGQDTVDGTLNGGPRPPGRYVSSCEIPGALLNDGSYSIQAYGEIPFVELFFDVHDAVSFGVEQVAVSDTALSDRWEGVVRPSLSWKVEREP